MDATLAIAGVLIKWKDYRLFIQLGAAWSLIVASL